MTFRWLYYRNGNSSSGWACMWTATAGTISQPSERVRVSKLYTFFYRPTVVWAVSIPQNRTHIYRLFSFSSGWLAASVCKNYTRISFLSFISFLYEEIFVWLCSRAGRTIFFFPFVYFSSPKNRKKNPIALESRGWCHKLQHKPWIWIYRVRHWALRLVLPEHCSSATVFTLIRRGATIQNTREKSENVSNNWFGGMRSVSGQANYVIYNSR